MKPVEDDSPSGHFVCPPEKKEGKKIQNLAYIFKKELRLFFSLFCRCEFSIPFCSKFYLLSNNSRAFFMILALEGAIVVKTFFHKINLF